MTHATTQCFRLKIHHTHAGSIGNLCNDKIAELMAYTINEFHFERAEQAEQKLLKG